MNGAFTANSIISHLRIVSKVRGVGSRAVFYARLGDYFPYDLIDKESLATRLGRYGDKNRYDYCRNKNPWLSRVTKNH